MKYNFSGRYTENLERVLDQLEAVEELFIEYEDGYAGNVDVGYLLKDGRVFSYRYSYGSCSGCDEWESRELDDKDIEKEMIEEATFFNNFVEYSLYRIRINKEGD